MQFAFMPDRGNIHHTPDTEEPLTMSIYKESEKQHETEDRYKKEFEIRVGVL